MREGSANLAPRSEPVESEAVATIDEDGSDQPYKCNQDSNCCTN